MKYILLLLLILQAFGGSSNTSPNALNQQVAVSAKGPTFTVIEYFSLDSMEQSLRTQEWYAFLTISASNKAFWMKFRVYLITVSKKDGKESSQKVQCFTDHNDLHGCYISSKRIKIEEQNLKVQIIFIEENEAEIKLEINTVYNLKPGEIVTLQKGLKNFTRLFRMDIRQLSNFYYLLFEISQVNIVDQYKNTNTFIGSLEQTPPDVFRMSFVSFPYWDNRELAILEYNQLQQAEYITILMAITDDNKYFFRSQLIQDGKSVQQIQPNKEYIQAAKRKSYRIDLPKRDSSIYYLLRIKIDSFFIFQTTNIKLNGQSINRYQLQNFLRGSGTYKNDRETDVWLNSTILSLQFTFVFEELGLYSIYLSEFNTNLINLPQRLFWQDQLINNQTQYIYLVIDTKTSVEKINLEIKFGANITNPQIKFRNCVEKSIQKCQQTANSIDETTRLIGMPVISPKKRYQYPLFIYQFNDLVITKYQIEPYQYRSIVIVEVVAPQPLVYALNWLLINPVEVIKPNQLIHGSIQGDSIRTFCFTVIDSTNMAFARVHFTSGTVGTTIYGYPQERLSFETDMDEEKIKKMVFDFDGSVTFTTLKNKTTYYVYVRSGKTRDYFQLTLTYGYNTDDDKIHPISHLTLGQDSRTQLILNPLQILFVQINTDKIGLISIYNDFPLKICSFYTPGVPQSHQDMKKSQYCQTYSNFNFMYSFRVANTSKCYIGIQNEQPTTASITIHTENDQLICGHSQMGQTKFLIINKGIKNQNQTHHYCVMYPLSQKGQIQIFIDLNNPKLQGLAHPQVSIGQKYNEIITTNLLLISQQKIDEYCEQIYERCLVKITINSDKTHQIYQQYIPISVSYTSQPLMLKDGLARHSNIKPNQVKHFKYTVYSGKYLTATLQSQRFSNSVSFCAKVITSNEKFIYPKEEECHLNNTNVFVSVFEGYFYPLTLTIKQQVLDKKCNKKSANCYVLFSVFNKMLASQSKQQKFLLQVTQTINTLTASTKSEHYIQKDSKAYFNFKNNNAKSLLFFTTSNVNDCLKIDIFKGNQKILSKNALVSGNEEVLIEKAENSWYTAVVLARQSCFFTMQVSASNKSLRQLTFGYANQFSLDAGEKIYYITHNLNKQMIKIVASLKQEKSGELMLKGMPVTDSQIGDFIKFINGQLQLTKKEKIEFIWSDINHLTLRKSDKKFCTNCYICIQAEASKHLKGYLTIPSVNKYSLYLQEYISYDILLKGQSFSWLTQYGEKGQIFIAIQAGELEIIVETNSNKELKRQKLKYNKMSADKNLIKIQKFQEKLFENIHIKVVAIQNSDYSIYSKHSTKDRTSHFFQIGRPNYLFIQKDKQQCFAGESSQKLNQFVIWSRRQVNISQVKQNLSIVGSNDGKNIDLDISLAPDSIIISFVNQGTAISNTFEICIANKGTSFFDGSITYIGNLNYFPQNYAINIKKSMNLTFMSQGKGVIQIDQCSSRSTISLNNNFKDTKNTNSKINSRRSPNHLISFNYIGSVYMHVQTEDYVALRWKNMHVTNKNGYGYELYSPSTFKILYDEDSKDLFIKINYLQENAQKFQLPEILKTKYNIFISQEELDLYNAMNCQKGKFMSWTHKVEDHTEMKKQFVKKLNNIQDIKKTFRGRQYVLIIVKAQVEMKWPNNFTQTYRFYYPYQQIILAQFPSELSKEQGNKTEIQQNSSNFVIFLLIAVVVIGFLTILAMRCIKRNIWRTSFFVQQSNNGTELQTKVQSQNADIKSIE